MTAGAPPLPFGSAELRAEGARVVLLPALGGKIIGLELGGREWLWRNPRRPYRAAEDGARFVGLGDSGGYDECFPTIAPCTLPSHVSRYGGLSLPDHGELWSQPSTFSLETRDDGMHAVCGWHGRRMPYRFVRGVFVGGGDRVEMHYAVTNDGPVPMPFVWAARVSLPLGRTTRIVLPEGSRLRVWSQDGIELGGPGAELRWPRVVVAGRITDLAVPDAIGRAFACKVFVESAAGRAAVEEDGVRLEVAMDGARLPGIGVGIDRRRSALRRRHAAHHVTLEPGMGAPDSLAESLGAWRSAPWLQPGETLEWTLVWQARPVNRENAE